MRFFFLLSFFILLGLDSLGQKSPTKNYIEKPYKIDKLLIDSTSYDRWPIVESVNLTDNGEFVYYSVDHQSVGSRGLILQATKGVWKIEFHNIDNVEFTADSKRAIVTKSDRIYIVNLGTRILDSLSNIISYRLSNEGEWIAYQQKGPEERLVVKSLRTLRTDRSAFFLSVKDYFFSNNSGIIFLQREEKTGTDTVQVLDWANIASGRTFNFWKGSGLRSMTLSNDGSGLAFIARDKDETKSQDGIWYYKFGTNESHFVLSGVPGAENENLELGNLSNFSNDNSRLFITLREKKYPKRVIDHSQPDVWNFNDKKLQSQQLQDPDSRTYNAIVDIQKSNLFLLERENEMAWIFNNKPSRDSIAVVTHQENDGRSGENGWNPACNPTSYLISTKTGIKTSIGAIKENVYPELSVYGKYLIYYDRIEKNYFTYEIGKGVIRNISKGINNKWEKDNGKSIEGWLNNDSAVIVYDENDVWLLDPVGVFSPVNITNGYGKRNNIIFSLTWSNTSNGIINSEEKLFLTAFNPDTKENGFYSAKLGRKTDPVLLTMGSFIYDIPNNTTTPQGSSFTPIKAKKVNSFIVRRMSATEYPNLFFTNDFKTFKAITDFQPQNSYNWYTSELHEWKSLDGTSLKGILYKPENFDSSRKYPVIFNYYESKSDGLNAFIMPEQLISGCVINIPYYVSNGYLVFCPDIKYTTGEPMQSAYNAIVSAAEHVSKLPFVDAKKMGLQGCSWGAIQTNYLITRTNLFAAACSASGIADWISGFGSLSSLGNSLQGMYEGGQFRMGGTLWDKLDSYIKNSPVLKAYDISTPILLMHTKDDGICSFSNAIEFFTALRRLGKRSWMLVYPGDHGIYGKEGMDFSIRMSQFFDHYLKDKPAPIWMTKGVSAKLKGIDSGLNLDYTIKTPTESLLIDTTNKTANK